jgi:hypothetical protein
MPITNPIIGLPCGKGKSDDVPQLQDEMQEIREDPERAATVSLLQMPQDLLGSKERVPGRDVHAA